MKKFSIKKIALVICSLSLVAVLAVGATLAWFTDSKEANNVVTFGNVKIELTEDAFEPDVPAEEGLGGTMTNVVPGDVIPKDPTIENIGKNPCYLRVKVAISGTLLEEKTADDITACLDIDESNWMYEDGYYYYKAEVDGEDVKKVLQPDEIVELFSEVTLPTTWGNEVADKTLNLDITAEAVQSENFDGNWPTIV